MKRTGFARKVYVPPPRAPLKPLSRPVVYGEPMPFVSPVMKENPLRSEPYRKLVATLPCIMCGAAGISQAAHADMGKGAGIKTDDRTCFPACSTQPGRVGCHDTIGASGELGKEKRRELERLYGAETRAKIIAMGLWPSDLPRWPE